jgi:hypothetical protein
MNSHAAHWRPYLELGDMVVFGPVLTGEDSYGLAVVETGDEQVLRAFAAQDAVVTTGNCTRRAGAAGRRSRLRALTGVRKSRPRGWRRVQSQRLARHERSAEAARL